MDELTVSAGSHATITLNGKTRLIEQGISVLNLLAELDLRERLVVVERNGAILSRSAFPDTLLADGDVVEVVHFVGGG